MRVLFPTSISLILILSTFQCMKAQNYIVQLSVFQEPVPRNYFNYSNLENVKEFKDINNFYRYYLGPYQSKKEADLIVSKVQKKGFLFSKILDKEDLFAFCGRPCWYQSSKDSMQNILVEKIKAQNIYFAYNDYVLDSESEKTLFYFYDLLSKNPQFKIQISGHADSKGSATYNLKLSKRRTRSARDYLISKGIEEERLDMKVFGESAPITKNQNAIGDIPLGRKYNRRVSLSIFVENGLIVSENNFSEIPEALRIIQGIEHLPSKSVQARN